MIYIQPVPVLDVAPITPDQHQSFDGWDDEYIAQQIANDPAQQAIQELIRELQHEDDITLPDFAGQTE